jgi:plastocyanin
MLSFKKNQNIFLIGLIFGLLFLSIQNARVMAYEVAPVDGGGELFGTIKIKGDPPENKAHTVVNNADFCGNTVQEETYQVNSTNQGLKNVVIHIEGIQKGKKETTSIVIIENKKCHFTPHVMTGMIGNSYEIRNSDPVLHNTHLYMEDISLLNVAMPSGGKNIRRSFTQTGLVKAKCDAHKFMQGWVVVTDNPYSAVTDEEGNYRISEIPPGKYRIKVWHEGVPGKEREVTILTGKKTELSLNLDSNK